MTTRTDELIITLLEILEIDTKGLEEVIITARPNEFSIDCKYARYGLNIDERDIRCTLKQTLKHYELIKKEDE